MHSFECSGQEEIHAQLIGKILQATACFHNCGQIRTLCRPNTGAIRTTCDTHAAHNQAKYRPNIAMKNNGNSGALPWAPYPAILSRHSKTTLFRSKK